MKSLIIFTFLILLSGTMANAAFYAPDSLDAKQLTKLKKKHDKWYSGFIVNNNGDTIHGKIKDTDDYSGHLKILFAYPNEREQEFDAYDLKQLSVNIEDPEYTTYITIGSFHKISGLTTKFFYRVIVDGICKLLFNPNESDGTASMMGPGGTMMGGGGKMSNECYSVYYKGVRTKIQTGTFFNISPQFRKVCGEIFSECPELVEKIENKTFHCNNLREVVTEFNKCIGGNNIPTDNHSH